MATRVKIENLNSAVMEILTTYADDVADGTDDAADMVSKQCMKEIKSNARATFKGKKYYKSWARKQTSIGRGKSGYTIYSKMPGLPHLLENGHANVDGGRTAGRPHIAPAEEKAVKEFQQRVEEVVKNASN